MTPENVKALQSARTREDLERLYKIYRELSKALPEFGDYTPAFKARAEELKL